MFSRCDNIKCLGGYACTYEKLNIRIISKPEIVLLHAFDLPVWPFKPRKRLFLLLNKRKEYCYSKFVF